MIAIDPGNQTGWALFDGGQLQSAGASPKDEVLAEPPFLKGAQVVLELPRIYPQGRSPANPNRSIRPLMLMVGDLQGFYRRAGLEVTLIEPKGWKGQVPKTIHHRRLLAKLTDEEKARLPKRPRAKDFDHNMLDAVGLGLWKLEREKR